jgi:hypothetical protein
MIIVRKTVNITLNINLTININLLSMATFLARNSYEFSTISKLILIRHGESIWNKQRKWAGWKDIRLSPTGIK